MPVINVLSKDLANKIAAGEVIERPVSVVKELVENAIDAGANRIFVNVTHGGKTLIKVTDNGDGLSKEDLPLAIIRHATSKITSKEDLFKIASLGFRGEALPSIASVSKMIISSSHQGKAYKMTLEGCEPKTIEETSLGKGTTISVEDLFYNLPARQKFLKGEATEYAQILDYLKKLTLSSPHISFALNHNNKKSFETQGLKDNKKVALKHALSKVYGTDILNDLLDISLETEQGNIWGVISGPSKTKGDRKALNTFVNNRTIYSPIITKAISNALRDILPANRFPYLVLFIELDPATVDVNVHPTKKEVRFAKGQEIFSLVTSAIRNAFLASEISKRREPPKDISQKTEEISFAPKFEYKESFARDTITSENIVNQLQTEIITKTQNISSFSHEPVEKDNNLIILGQANRSWIIVLEGDDLLLIDQHAAHERINYEILKNNREKSALAQGLLIPLSMELSPQQLAILEAHKDILIKIGFEIDMFSETSIILRAVPQNLKQNIDYTEVFLELLTEIDQTGKGLAPDKLSEEVLKMTACKASIKAGETLTHMEMKQLVKDLYNTNNFLSCPHGRPLITTITDSEIRKRFLR